MKIKFLSSIFVLTAFAAVGNDQSVVVTSKKVTYTRPKPVADYKKSFTITYPKIKAATPTLSKKIENAFSYQRILGVDLNGELNDIQWLESADYKVKYNKNGSLCIELSIEGSGAYPSSSSKVVVVDTRTGLRARPIDVFTNRTGLVGVLRKMQEKEK